MTATAKDDAQVLALQKSLHAAGRFRSPAVGALLTLAILLGKAIVCRQAPGRAVFFDAMLMVPISLLAYHEGLATGLVAGLVATIADLVLGAKAAGMLIPTYLVSGTVRSMFVTRLFSLEVVAGIVAVLTGRSRREMSRAERRTQKYLRQIYLLERHNAAMKQDARTKQAEFEKSLLKFSSLIYLLEESAQKIYSNLEIDRLFQSLFRVLEECFGSTCASVYLKDARNGAFFLANACGTNGAPDESVPMMLRPDDLTVTELGRTRRAVYWQDETVRGGASMMERVRATGQPAPAVISGTLVDKGDVMGIINVHAVDRDAPPDTRLMSVVCNIASIALVNARLFGEVNWMAERDPLTKLYNRRSFHTHLESQISARTANSERFGLLMLDIDHFKSFNDTYGHQAGDAVLEWFARHCEEACGDTNLLYRYGGEEFTVLMPRANVVAAHQLAETIRRRIETATFNYDGIDLRVTLSCGVAAFPDNGVNEDELVRKVDRALYRAKGAGRNTVAVSETGPGHDSAIVPYEVQMANRAEADGQRTGDQAPPPPGPPKPPGGAVL